MSDDLKKLQQDLALIAASLEALSANVKANNEDFLEMMRRMEARGRLMDGDLQSLKGTFASIGEHMTKLFERDAATQAWKKQMEARMEALERKAS